MDGCRNESAAMRPILVRRCDPAKEPASRWIGSRGRPDDREPGWRGLAGCSNACSNGGERPRMTANRSEDEAEPTGADESRPRACPELTSGRSDEPPIGAAEGANLTRLLTGRRGTVPDRSRSLGCSGTADPG